jgi:hypothetical protein
MQHQGRHRSGGIVGQHEGEKGARYLLVHRTATYPPHIYSLDAHPMLQVPRRLPRS